jgi:hypothetical protein
LSDLKDLDDFEVRFANWLAWCRMKGLHQGHAGSVEGRYRSPQHWDPVSPKPQWLLTMDINDAVLLNRAFSQLGEYTRRVIKILWFRPHWRVQWQAQKLQVHHTELADLGYRSKRMMENRLKYIERKEKAVVIKSA